MKKKIIIIAFLVALAVGVTYLAKPKNLPFYGELIPTNERIRHKPIVLGDYIRYPGKDGKNAFELLKEQVPVESKQYDFGVFIESINAVKPDDKHFWKLYINGQEAQVGADQLQTKDGDIIEWRIEEINNNQ